MIPSQYGLSGTSPEAYVACAVDDLIYQKGKSVLHVVGDPTPEYLGMLALYAIRYAISVLPEGEPVSKIAKLSYDNFDPFSMSDNLIRCLTDLVMSEEKQA